MTFQRLEASVASQKTLAATKQRDCATVACFIPVARLNSLLLACDEALMDLEQLDLFCLYMLTDDVPRRLSKKSFRKTVEQLIGKPIGKTYKMMK